MSNIKNIEKLLKEFNHKKKGFSRFKYEPTFLEISKYPHYENVCSNILEFFFDVEGPHGLKDLFVKSLLLAIDKNIIVNPISSTKVTREELLNGNLRLDLVIETDEYVICIENKIYAILNNDLDEYSNHIDSKCGSSKIGKKVVLSLYNVKGFTHPDFVNITYDEFFDKINLMLGDYWQDANQKYLIFLKEFMQTMSNNKNSNSIDPDLLNFFKTNLSDIEDMVKAIKDIRKYFKYMTTYIEKNVDYNSMNKKFVRWNCRDEDKLYDVLVHEVIYEETKIAIDTFITPENMGILIFLRRNNQGKIKSKDELRTWLVSIGINDSDLKYHPEMQERLLYKNTTDDIEEIIKNLTQLLDILDKNI